MSQLFPRYANPLTRLVIIGGAIAVASMVWGWKEILRSPFVSRAGYVRSQPVAFSHRTHVKGLSMDCRFCHATVETSAFAGIPPTKTCMACHASILSDSPILEPVRQSYATDQPIPWVRLHDLPDFAHFDHSIHISQGVGCSTCHGSIGEMPRTEKGATLHMDWCLDCHRHPQGALRAMDEVFDPDWIVPADQETRGTERLSARSIDTRLLQDCSTCHQ